MQLFWTRKGRSKTTICNEFIALDIETSNNHAADPQMLKTWISSIQVLFNEEYHLFRKPSELIDYLLELIDRYKLNPDRRIVCVAHNASYDLSYLIPWFQEYLPKEPRSGIYESVSKIICYSQYCFDFRCTYMLTGKSLAKWSAEMNVEHQKQVGLYDYSEIIYQDTELTSDQELYDKYDVLALSESYRKQMQKHNDTTVSVPLTSTGYCRRHFRKGTKQDRYYRDKHFLIGEVDCETYKMELDAFAGGYVHNNKWKKSKVNLVRMRHRDFRSHYPTQLRVNLMPYGKYRVIYDHNYKFYGSAPSLQDIVDMYPEYYCLVHIGIWRASLKDQNITMPFLQESKMFNRTTVESIMGKFNCFSDNGRVMQLISGAAEMVVDNLTLKILLDQYHLSVVVQKVIAWEQCSVPKCITDTIDELFKKKSDLKTFHREMCKKYGEHSDEAFNAAFELNTTKALLNACYGMFGTRSVMPEYDLDYEKYFSNPEEYDSPLFRTKNIDSDKEITEALEKFYDNPNSFLPYIVAGAVTSCARFELFEYIKVIGYDKVYYCDTDSIFYEYDPEVEKRIEKLNKEKHKKAPYVVTDDGKKVYYDVFEEEPDLIAFKGLHSKCYGYVTTENELCLTIAGIPARTMIGMKDGKPIYLTREEELAGITPEQKLENPSIKIDDPVAVLDKLTDHFPFTVNTGTTAYYVKDRPHTEVINGHVTELAGGAVITRPDKTLIIDYDVDDFDVEYYNNEREEFR